MIQYDISIIGAGIVGLATAYQLLKKNSHLKIRILEKEKEVGCHQTGRNSGVVHTGVYYKPGSLKAQNCILGRAELLQFCDEEGIPYKNKHKLIVATSPTQFPALQEIAARGAANQVPGLKLIETVEAAELEPNVVALKALFVPHCHIVDFKKVALGLARKIVQMGAEIVYEETVERVLEEQGRVIVLGKNKTYTSLYALNCAGLHSDRLAKGLSSSQILPFRGEYYLLREERNGIVNGLIYPVPDPKFPFLGVHLTEMMNGHVEAGPNAVLAFAREGYKRSDFAWKDMWELLQYPGFWKMGVRYWKAGCYEMARSLSKKLFLKDLQKLVPSIQLEDLLPGGAGIRAQVVTREGKLLDDFAFARSGNILHVLNAPSPAATASFSIGKLLAEKIDLLRN